MANIKISLAKALKMKNRLAGRLAKVQVDIVTYNSVPEGQADQVDVRACMKMRDELVEALVVLKSAVSDANRAIQRDIFEMAEKKGTVQFLAGIATRHGMQPAIYPNTGEVMYVAALKKAELDGLQAGLEAEIDRLQDKLDQFNHTQMIELSDRVLELAS